jgi:hypothetical protein
MKGGVGPWRPRIERLRFSIMIGAPSIGGAEEIGLLLKYKTHPRTKS